MLPVLVVPSPRPRRHFGAAAGGVHPIITRPGTPPSRARHPARSRLKSPSRHLACSPHGSCHVRGVFNFHKPELRRPTACFSSVGKSSSASASASHCRSTGRPGSRGGGIRRNARSVVLTASGVSAPNSRAASTNRWNCSGSSRTTLRRFDPSVSGEFCSRCQAIPVLPESQLFTGVNDAAGVGRPRTWGAVAPAARSSGLVGCGGWARSGHAAPRLRAVSQPGRRGA